MKFLVYFIGSILYLPIYLLEVWVLNKFNIN